MFALKNFGPKKKKRLIKMKLGTDTDSKYAEFDGDVYLYIM